MGQIVQWGPKRVGLRIKACHKRSASSQESQKHSSDPHMGRQTETRKGSFAGRTPGEAEEYVALTSGACCFECPEELIEGCPPEPP